MSHSPCPINSGVPQVALDTSGNAIVVWSQANSTIWVNRYDATTSSWAGAELIETNNAAESLDVGIDATGSALVVWIQSNNVWAIRYDASSSSWGNAVSIETGGREWSIGLAIGAAGSAFAVWAWSEVGGGGQHDVYAARLDPTASSWSGAELINPNINGNSWPQVAVDPSGHAIAVWSLYPGRNVVANHYDSESLSWGAAEVIAPKRYYAGPFDLLNWICTE